MKKLVSMLITLSMIMALATTAVCEVGAINVGRIKSYNGLQYYTDEISGTAICGYVGTDPEVVIPEKIEGLTVSEIAQEAFYKNDIITSVKMPSTLKRLGSRAFSGCKNLSEITIPKSVEEFGSTIFTGTGIKTATFEDGTKEVPDNVFEFMTNLEKVNLPNSITQIGNLSFFGCSALKDVDLPDNLVTLGSSFSGCRALETITIPKTLAEFTDSPFANSGLKTAYFEEGTEYVPQNLFYSATMLEKVVLPDSIKSIKSNAFAHCYKLSEINMPTNLESVGNGAFSHCFELKSMIFANSLKEAGFGIFEKSGITEVKLAEGTTEIPHGMFYYADKIEAIDIPDSVKVIGEAAFSACTKLKSITIPEGVEQIDKKAFDNCKVIEEIIIPATVTKMGEEVFYNTYSKLIVKGYKNTAAQRCAEKEGVTFVSYNDDPIGDVDRDGRVDVKDSTLLQKYFVGLGDVDAVQVALGEVSGDGEVNVVDVTRIQKMVVGLY